MAHYANGRIPDSMLVWFVALNQYGQWERFRGTRAFVKRWNRMVKYVRKHYGFTLTITSGPNVYRDFAQQVAMEIEYGLGAATPGTSSHGGTFEGRQTIAVDVNNWARLGRDTFYRIARMFGFTPGLISRRRGYARTEEWHLVLFNPWSMPSWASSSAAKVEEDPMPKHENKGYNKPQTLKKGEWVSPGLSSKNDQRFAYTGSGDRGEIGDVTVWLRFSGGTPGQAIAQVRFVHDKFNSKGKDVSANRTPAVEITGSTGETFGQMVAQYSYGQRRRGRIEVLALQDGVTLERVEYTKNYWRD